MLYRIEAGVFSHLDDTPGRKVARALEEALNLPVADVRLIKVYTLDGFSAEQAHILLDTDALHDPVLQQASLSPLPTSAHWVVEVGARPGVTDNEGRTARDTAALVLGLDHAAREKLAVYTAAQYHITARPDHLLSHEDVTRAAKDLLANELIQRFEIKSGEEMVTDPFVARAAKVTGSACNEVGVIPLSSMDDDALLNVSRENTLALNLTEMRAIRDHFLAPETRRVRGAQGLPADPTDAEVEMLAQTWSEHCKHKIFAARVMYEDHETGEQRVIDGLYKSCIQNATRSIRESRGDRDFCRSVFTDNAGVVAFNDTHDVCIKVETHNSPSALDPYGGALTGIVGVNRDPLGTGLGAELVCNTDVFCFASPFYDAPLPPRLLHPRRVMEGVREGVEHGGNKSGVPTVNGSIVFDERFLGKPLVFCGTVGLMPRFVPGLGGKGEPRPGYSKQARPGDVIVMVGGRIGKDGIHGATFSSEELHEGSPATAVQIGDPITQRKVVDFIIRARDAGLYSAITDNGAGGLSSSVCEMAEDAGGCRIDLSRAPLKYDGLRPWEILLSEAQERMTLAVPPDLLDAFMALAAHMDVEASALGVFEHSGFVHVTYGDAPVAYMDMRFLHKGLPRMELPAVWTGSKTDADPDAAPVCGTTPGTLLKRLLARPNICSKEYLIRQYDHEVRGGSVVKPLVGVAHDGPGDAGVLRPVLESEAGLVISHGICPKFSDFDTYWMTACAVDEAVRNAVAVGADPDRLAGVDNFCWCDPVQSEKNPDGAHKMAQLVRSCEALDHFCRAYGVPCVSGKDSMKNDYVGGGVKISIPPTLLFSVLGVVDTVNLAVTSDLKNPGDRLYLLGLTRRELGGSELCAELGQTVGRPPIVDAQAALALYRSLHTAMTRKLVSACHDLSDGGLGVALAEMCIGGRLGARIDADRVPVPENAAFTLVELLFAESAGRLLVSVPEAHAADFERLFAGQTCACVGTVLPDPQLIMIREGGIVMDESVTALTDAFKGTFQTF